MIASRFRMKVMDPDLQKGAVWTYYEGAYRDTGRDEGATMVLATEGRKGWFWYIPLHRNIVSVGVVSSFGYLFDGRGSHEQIYYEELDLCPAVKQRVSKGKRVADFYAAIVEGLAKGDTSAAQLGNWTAGYNQGMDRMRRLVCEYYNGFSFGQFVKRYPDLKGHITDLLIGDLFEDKVDDVIEPMNSMKAMKAVKTTE
jgi:hypothetical protein